jgi:hypothetical protein
MSSQVKKSCQPQLRDKKHQYFSTVSLPTDSVIVDHTVVYLAHVKFEIYPASSNIFALKFTLINVF